VPRRARADAASPGGEGAVRGEEPYRRLWLAVIKHALHDLTNGSGAIRLDARDFLLNDEQGLAIIARLAHLSPRRVRRRALSALEGLGRADRPLDR